MKQPVNTISAEDVGCGNRHEWTVWIDTDDRDNRYQGVCIGFASNEASALRLAIKRLDRLKRDCERELAKQEVGK